MTRPPVVAAIAAAFVAAVVAGATLFTVEQTEQVLITQLGQPVRVIDQPGLHAKVPLIQSVISFDRRVLDYEVPAEEVILGDQRRLIVDSFTRYRITDPLRYYQAVGAQEDAVRGRLNSVVSSALRRVLGNEQLLNVLSSQRQRIMNLIRDQVDEEMRGFGIAVVDVRIRRADLPQENKQAVLQRMQSERERVARQARAEGAETQARIRADADRERTVLLADARAQADKLRGEGEAQATNVYAAAFSQDAEFFRIWRTLQSYREAFAGGQSRLVLTQDSQFLRMLGGTSPGGSEGQGSASTGTPAPSATAAR